jgi:hypothetical protein
MLGRTAAQLPELGVELGLGGPGNKPSSILDGVFQGKRNAAS